jgi:hypothetical protein
MIDWGIMLFWFAVFFALTDGVAWIEVKYYGKFKSWASRFSAAHRQKQGEVD